MVNIDFLELKNIDFFYKKNNFILKNLNVKFFGGKITALLGINGSGKTTLFKILTGVFKTQSGSFYYNDTLINKNNIIEYKSLLGFMPEFLQLYKNMYVKDVLTLLGDLKGYKNFDLNGILDTVFLLEHSNKKVKALSKGMKQRLNLAQAIIGDPKIILFDEPSNGFDCGSITMFYGILKRIVSKGSIVLLSSHHLTEIYGNVDKVLILSDGKIIKEIDMDSFEHNNDFLYKEVFIQLKEKIRYEVFSLLNIKFNDLKIKDGHVLFGRVNNKIIVDLILEIIKLNLIIKDIRIENKILEDALVNLS